MYIALYSLSSVFPTCHHLPSQLRELDLSWCEEVTEAGVDHVATHCVGLRSLVLRHCTTSIHSLHLLVANCTNLTHLNLSDVHVVVDSLLVSLALSLKQLCVLDVSWNSGESRWVEGGLW